jgi:hypothetical protein
VKGLFIVIEKIFNYCPLSLLAKRLKLVTELSLHCLHANYWQQIIRISDLPKKIVSVDQVDINQVLICFYLYLQKLFCRLKTRIFCLDNLGCYSASLEWLRRKSPEDVQDRRNAS